MSDLKMSFDANEKNEILLLIDAFLYAKQKKAHNMAV